MNDIVERLRTSASQAGYPKHYIYDEAADEIERLRKEAARLRAEIVLLEAVGAEASDEIDRLRVAQCPCGDGTSADTCAGRCTRFMALAKEPGHG